MGPPPSYSWAVALARGVARSHAPPTASGAPRGQPGRVSLAIRGVLLLSGQTSASVTTVYLLSSSSSPGLDPRGPRQASVRSLRSEPVLLHLSFTTPYRDSEEGKRGGCRDSAPCVAGRGRGAGAPPAPGMRARALASTSLLLLSRLEPPLADSGESECASHPPRRAPGPSASGNVSGAACTFLRPWMHHMMVLR